MNIDEIEEIVSEDYEAYRLDKSHPCYEASEDPDWSYEPVFTELLISEYHKNDLDEVLRWWDSEVYSNPIENPEDPRYYKKLEKIYLSNQENMPIIVLEGSDGYFYINNGHHRYAIALKHQMSPVYCIVGKIKK